MSGKTKGNVLSVRVDNEVNENLKKYAEEQERSVSWMAGKCIKEYLKQKMGKDYEYSTADKGQK